jgi:chromosome segregation ATPase
MSNELKQMDVEVEWAEHIEREEAHQQAIANDKTKAEYDKINDALPKARIHLETMQKEYLQAEIAVEEAMKTMDAVQAEIDKKAKEIDEAEKPVIRAKEALIARNKNVQKLQAQLKRAEDALAGFEAEVASRNTQSLLMKYRKDLEKARAQEKTAEDNKTKAEAAVASMDQRYTALQAALKKAKEEVDAARAVWGNAKGELTAVNDEIKELEADNRNRVAEVKSRFAAKARGEAMVKVVDDGMNNWPVGVSSLSCVLVFASFFVRCCLPFSSLLVVCRTVWSSTLATSLEDP